MKPHLIIKLKDQPDNPKFDYWESLISDKSNLSTRFIPSVDAIIKDKYKYDFIASQNYKSKNKDWSSDELKAGLNRIYRLILLTSKKDVPKEMVDEISLIPHISYINTGQIISSTIPKTNLCFVTKLKFEISRPFHLFKRGTSMDYWSSRNQDCCIRYWY